MPTKHNDLKALKRLLKELELLITTTTLPQGRGERFKEALSAAIALTDDLLDRTPAAELGKLGGQETAKRGPEYFAQIAGLRKNRSGGRPRKTE